MRVDWLEKEMLHLCDECLPEETGLSWKSDCTIDLTPYKCDLCGKEVSPAVVISVYNALKAMSAALQGTAKVVERKRVETLNKRFNHHEVMLETHRIVSFLRKEQGKDGQEWFHREVLRIWTNPPWISPLELDAAIKQLLASKTIETKKFPENGDAGGDLADFYRLTTVQESKK